jgi:4-hydroxybenzoate polyprenyltransferase
MARKKRKTQSRKQVRKQKPEPKPGLATKIDQYLLLMRVDKPIGILLLLWPTLWTLWLAAEGVPTLENLAIFALGCFLMRSAGCVINDFADRNIDGKVKRTRHRPIVNGTVSPREAILLFVLLCTLAFLLVCLTNTLTIMLSVVGVTLAAIYPFAKRYTYMPQVVLGAAFGWAVPMAWAAETNSFSPDILLVYLAVLLWTVVYDTFYAMVDRDDDVKIGVKSTAILFGDADRMMTGILQGLALFCLLLAGEKFGRGMYFYAGLGAAGLLFIYQQYLIRERKPELCFKAFMNNNWVGLVIFAGVFLDFYFSSS